jgi:hypothetical protein
MRWLFLIVLLINGCAATKSISTTEYSQCVDDYALASSKYYSAKKQLDQAEEKLRGFNQPPFLWKPDLCTARKHENSWPDFSAVDETMCMWTFFPLNTARGMIDQRMNYACQSRWRYKDSDWAHMSTTCKDLGQPP